MGETTFINNYNHTFTMESRNVFGGVDSQNSYINSTGIINLINKNIAAQNLSRCKVLALPPKPMFGLEIGGFAAILEVLVIDIFLFMGITIIFSIVSKKARIDHDLREPIELNWFQLFYGDTNAALRSSDIEIDVQRNLGSPKSFFYWIRAVLFLRQENFLKRSGHDAVSYLSFQRCIILLSITITLLSVLCIIPVSYIGRFEGTRQAFARTTIANIDPKSSVMWFYPIIGFVLFAIAFLFLKDYASTLVLNKHLKGKRTLIVSNIAEKDRSKALLELFFSEVYPSVRVDNIELTYNVKRLTDLNTERLNLESCLAWCEDYTSRTQERPQLIPKLCGLCCASKYCCSCCKRREDAINYYTRQKTDLLTKMQDEKLRILQKPLSLAFVSFETVNMLHYVLANKDEHKRRVIEAKELSFGREWLLTESPNAYNIYWKNLHASRTRFWILNSMLYAAYFIFVLCLSTPNVVLSLLHLEAQLESAEIKNVFLERYLPSFLLLLLSSTLPLVVAFSGEFLPYFTKSEYHRSIVLKTYTYLLFMILILPLTEFTSVAAVLQKATIAPGELLRWECVFLPDNGAFFASFLIQAGFIGTGIQLFRVGELVGYAIFTLFAKSEAELVGTRKAVWYEFDFGFHYTFYLVCFTVSVVFATSVPLVALCGLIYLINKHCVDRYNLFFANSPTQVGRSVHTTPVNLAIFAFVLQQLLMTLYAFIRGGPDSIFAVYFGGLIFTFLIFLVQVWAPDVAVLHIFALPHTRILMKIKNAIKIHSARHKARVWSCHEVEEELVTIQDYKPEVLQMDYVPQSMQENLSDSNLV